MPVVAVIPAKNFSRRLPGKNMRVLAGLPLFAHSVRTALTTAGIDLVVVSSDDDALLAQAAQYGAKAMKRPAELCTDDATNFQVLCHLCAALRAEGVSPDTLVLLQPTTPFRTADDLASMIQRFSKTPEASSLITVAPVTRVLGGIENGWWRPTSPLVKGAQRLKSADTTYGVSGHVYILRPEKTLDVGALLGQNVLAEPLPAGWPDIDIDTPDDWAHALTAAPLFFQSGP